jgi:CRISPR-associated protein Csd1
VQAFNDLASSREHRWGYPDDRTATIWWTKQADKSKGIFALLNDPDPIQIKRMLDSVRGPRQQLSNVDASRFYALTYSGNVARLVIRSWLDKPLTEAERNIRAWFCDIETTSLSPIYPALSSLARSTGVVTRSQGRWKESMPEGAFDVLLDAAINGSVVPRSLLIRAVARARAEVHLDGIPWQRSHARLCLIKLILNRDYLKENPMQSSLDESRPSPIYLSGRLFAVRESLQFQASGQLNSSIVDRYFALASQRPAAVEQALTTLEKQHLRALERKRGKGAMVSFDKRIMELHNRIGEAPDRLSATQSAEWIAGYYQQRQHDFAASQARQKEKITTDNEMETQYAQ